MSTEYSLCILTFEALIPNNYVVSLSKTTILSYRYY